MASIPEVLIRDVDFAAQREMIGLAYHIEDVLKERGDEVSRLMHKVALDLYNTGGELRSRFSRRRGFSVSGSCCRNGSPYARTRSSGL